MRVRPPSRASAQDRVPVIFRGCNMFFGEMSAQVIVQNTVLFCVSGVGGQVTDDRGPMTENSRPYFIQAGRLGSLEAIRLKGSQIVQLSSLIAC